MAPSFRQATSHVLAAVLLVVLAIVVAAPSDAGAETPRRGGVLMAVIGADAPGLDPHQESTFATLQMVAPLYSTLLQIDPYHYPKIVGDVATDWKVSGDGLTYTFKIRRDITFHDGSPLTASDVKATYDKILSPPQGTRSIRKEHYTAVASVEAPDPATVVFKLKFPSASLLTNLASPWNVIYPKKYLDKDPNYFMQHAVGSGPFKFKSYTRGASFEGERNPDYFIKDRPYLNGYKFFISIETAVRAAAIRSGRAYVEFRDLPLGEVEAIKKQLGDKVVVQETPMVGQFGIGMQTTNRYITGASQNYGRFSDPVIDDLFARQARAIDPVERKKLVIQLQKRVLEQAYYMPGLWWTRRVVHLAKVKNYVAPPSHYTNQKLQDVWLSED